MRRAVERWVGVAKPSLRLQWYCSHSRTAGHAPLSGIDVALQIESVAQPFIFTQWEDGGDVVSAVQGGADSRTAAGSSAMGAGTQEAGDAAGEEEGGGGPERDNGCPGSSRVRVRAGSGLSGES